MALPRFVLLATLASAGLLSGCLDPSRLNARCEWVGDTGGAPLDLATGQDRRHLANDVRIAGEIATRTRDEVKLRLGFGAARGLDDQCLERLYTTIATQHGVRRADIDRAAFMRDVPIDVALIYLPVGALFLFVSSRLCRRRFQRLRSPDERWAALLGVAGLGLAAGGAATVVAYLHSWNVDSVRLRDFHMSFRVGYLPIGRHPVLAYLVALILFAAACWYEYRAARTRPAGPPELLSLRAWQDDGP